MSSLEFTAAEAAYLANACLAAEEDGDAASSAREALLKSALRVGPVNERSVNKAIEERVVEVHRKQDRLKVSPGVVLYVVATRRLTDVTLSKEAKRRLYLALNTIEKPTRTWKVELAPALSYEPGGVIKHWIALLGTYAKGRDRFVAVDSDVMGGVPVIKGTRITVYSVLSRLEGGDTLDDFEEDYPDVKREAFEAAVAYARAHPRRGRPKRFR